MASCGGWLTRSRYNIAVVSVAFLTLFSGYNPTQNLATSLFPQGLGNASLGVLYATVGATVFLAPAVVETFGSRASMVLGAACYVVYLASVIQIVPQVVLAMSTVIGFGAGILWVGLGVFITQNSSRATYGSNTGVFWSIFQCCQIAGNLAGYFINSNAGTLALFISFTVIAVVGTLLLLLLRPPQPNDAPGAGGYSAVAPEGTIQHGDSAGVSHAVAIDSPARHRVTCASFWSHAATSAVAAARLVLTPRMAAFLPIMFFSGLELSFWTGEFPQMVTASSVGLVLTLAGVGEVVGGFVFGRLADTCGRSVSAGLGLLLYAGGLAITGWMKAVDYAPAGPSWQGVPAPFYAAALLFGLGDSSMNANVYATVSLLYGSPEEVALEEAAAAAKLADDEGASAPLFDRKAPASAPSVERHTEAAGAFTVFQFVQNVGSAVGFGYALAYPLHGAGSWVQMWVQGVLWTVSLVSFVALDWFVVRHVQAAAKKATTSA